jgi:ZIP family zinc transporter
VRLEKKQENRPPAFLLKPRGVDDILYHKEEIVMSDILKTVVGILIPLIGTTLGAGFVFFLRGEIKPFVQKLLLGFASGVMIAASVWSLIIPAISMAEAQGVTPWVPAASGFLLGIFFLLALDSLIPHLHMNTDKPEGRKSGLGKSAMLVLAVTLHNLPEGMAVGVVFAGALAGTPGLTVAAAMTLAIGIALQNIPEGAVISAPLVGQGMKRRRAFSLGLLSGVVEPVGAVLTLLLTQVISPVLPYILSFAAGAMIYVVVEELIPEAQSGSHSNIGTIGAALGFVIMMVLDVAMG